MVHIMQILLYLSQQLAYTAVHKLQHARRDAGWNGIGCPTRNGGSESCKSSEKIKMKTDTGVASSLQLAWSFSLTVYNQEISASSP